MIDACFIDTSVLLNILDVPKHNEHHDEDAAELKRLERLAQG